MAYGLIGSVGTVSTGASGAAVTPSWGASSSQSAGNLLVCWVSGTVASGTPNPTTPTNWTEVIAVGALANACSAVLFYKIAAGGDPAPTIAAQGTIVWNVQLAEFSGNATSSPLDQSAGGALTSTLLITAGGADAAVGELLLYASGVRYGVTTAKTLANTLNNGASVHSTNNNAATTGSRYDFGYGITTSNSVADNDSFSFTSGSATNGAVAIASFKLPGAGLFSSGTINELPGFTGNIPGIC